jgi:CheY-like chemotaxis protein
VLVVEPDESAANRSLAYLEQWGLQATRVTDGGDALLRIFRFPPDLVIVGGHLPGVGGPSLTEIVRRVPTLKTVRIIRVTSIDEPSGAPEFEADVTLEPGDLPEALGGALKQLGVGKAPKPRLRQEEVRPARPVEPARAAPPIEPVRDGLPAPPCPPAGAEAAAPAARENEAAGDPRVADAQRLARIIVSDIVLYNEERFDRAARQGNLAEALDKELEEGRRLFQARVPEEIRRQRDFLVEELARVAAKRQNDA